MTRRVVPWRLASNIFITQIACFSVSLSHSQSAHLHAARLPWVIHGPLKFGIRSASGLHRHLHPQSYRVNPPVHRPAVMPPQPQPCARTALRPIPWLVLGEGHLGQEKAQGAISASSSHGWKVTIQEGPGHSASPNWPTYVCTSYIPTFHPPLPGGRKRPASKVQLCLLVPTMSQ